MTPPTEQFSVVDVENERYEVTVTRRYAFFGKEHFFESGYEFAGDIVLGRRRHEGSVERAVQRFEERIVDTFENVTGAEDEDHNQGGGGGKGQPSPPSRWA